MGTTKKNKKKRFRRRKNQLQTMNQHQPQPHQIDIKKAFETKRNAVSSTEDENDWHRGKMTLGLNVGFFVVAGLALSWTAFLFISPRLNPPAYHG